jgi:tetratricopeptide (TPR) repeat protein
MGLNQFGEAIEAYKRAAQINPKHVEAQHLLLEAYTKAGRSAEAEGQRRVLLGLRPNEAVRPLLVAGKFREAVAELQKIKNKDAETYFMMGNAYLELKQNGEAAAALRQAVRLDPKDPNKHFQLGNAHARLEQHADAAKDFAEVVRLKPAADAYFNLGNAYNKLNRLGEAAEAYEQSLKLEPNAADVRFALGVVHLRGGNRDAATEQYNALKGLNPEMANSLQQLLAQTGGAK